MTITSTQEFSFSFSFNTRMSYFVYLPSMRVVHRDANRTIRIVNDVEVRVWMRMAPWVKPMQKTRVNTKLGTKFKQSVSNQLIRRVVRANKCGLLSDNKIA